MLKQGRVYLEDGMRYYQDEHKTIMIDYFNLERFKLQYKPFELVFCEAGIASNSINFDIFTKIFTKPVSHYRQTYGQRKGDSVFIQESELYFWVVGGTLYFKTEEARTKFIMKWS